MGVEEQVRGVEGKYLHDCYDERNVYVLNMPGQGRGTHTAAYQYNPVQLKLLQLIQQTLWVILSIWIFMS